MKISHLTLQERTSLVHVLAKTFLSNDIEAHFSVSLKSLSTGTSVGAVGGKTPQKLCHETIVNLINLMDLFRN